MIEMRITAMILKQEFYQEISVQQKSQISVFDDTVIKPFIKILDFHITISSHSTTLHL